MTTRKSRFLIRWVLPAVALVSMLIGLAGVVPASAQAGILDHVTVAPASTTLAVGATQQFAAQGYDAANNPIAGLTYLWNVASGGGTISVSGLFTAGSTPGTFNNTVQAFAVQGSVIRYGSASVIVTAAAPGPLDHVTVTPATATLAAGATQQFTAQAFDAANVPIPGLSFLWSIVAGGGTISTAGLFTAGSVAGSFPNTVQAVAVQGSITKSGTASVTVSATLVTGTQLDDKALLRLIKASVHALGFDNFLGAQWSATVAGQPATVKAIPGAIAAISGTSLTLQPNGQTATQVFTLPGQAGVLEDNAILSVGEKVVVVTVNDTVRLVVPVPVRGSSGLGDENNGKGSDDEQEHEGRALGHGNGASNDSVQAPPGNALGRLFSDIQAPGRALGHFFKRGHGEGHEGHEGQADD